MTKQDATEAYGLYSQFVQQTEQIDKFMVMCGVSRLPPQVSPFIILAPIRFNCVDQKSWVRPAWQNVHCRS